MSKPANPGGSVAVVVMAKAAVPGKVKTRLTQAGEGGRPPLTAEQAALVHAAMLEAVLARVARIARGRARLLLAMDDPAGAPTDAVGLGWEIVAQGTGDLGERMGRVRQRGGADAAVFLGSDSPDAPDEALAAAIELAVGPGASAGAGPVEDGGYWTLAVRGDPTPLLRGIDWGTETVFEATRKAAQAASLEFVTLPTWFDVDHPADLHDLQERLAAHGREARPDPALTRLADRLDGLGSSPAGKTPSSATSSSTMDQASSAAASSAPSPAPAGSSAAEGVEGALIFVVDDNEQNVELLQAYLEQLPVTVETAMDGHEAMKRMEDADQPLPDLVLLDVMMPRMSGFEVCQRLKDDPRTRSVPIMMVTALNELGDIERGVEAGTDDFLPKPVNRLELITRVKSLLRVRHLKKELDRTEAYIASLNPPA